MCKQRSNENHLRVPDVAPFVLPILVSCVSCVSPLQEPATWWYNCCRLLEAKNIANIYELYFYFIFKAEALAAFPNWQISIQRASCQEE